MSGTIRANGDNSQREARRARIAVARRARQSERATLQYLDNRAIAAREAYQR